MVYEITYFPIWFLAMLLLGLQVNSDRESKDSLTIRVHSKRILKRSIAYLGPGTMTQWLKTHLQTLGSHMGTG